MISTKFEVIKILSDLRDEYAKADGIRHDAQKQLRSIAANKENTLLYVSEEKNRLREAYKFTRANKEKVLRQTPPLIKMTEGAIDNYLDSDVELHEFRLKIHALEEKEQRLLEEEQVSDEERALKEKIAEAHARLESIRGELPILQLLLDALE